MTHSTPAPTACIVKAVTPLTPSVYRVILEPQTAFEFKAGQYLLVQMGEEDKRPFSIASATHETNTIELHIGAEEANKYAFEVLTRLQSNDEVSVIGGLGEAHYQPEPNRPAILIAGGTGFSYTYSILKEALQADENADITLYWGAKRIDDLYLADELTKLSGEHPHFTFIPVVEFPEDDWHGRTGWVHKAALADFPSLTQYQVYIAGRFEMAKTARDDFFVQELPQAALFGDAYAFI